MPVLNTRQKVTLTISVAFALFAWVDAAGMGEYGQGQERFAVSVLVIGGLVTWFLQDPQKSR